MSTSFNNVYINDDELQEYSQLRIRMLTREIHKITKKGGLTDEEDVRLSEIDLELQYWNSIYYANTDEFDYEY
jgi:hypothetical protein